tara:strand:- start:510 stop:1430 length:921 start_codon:yes stop_codon:yes gene_type:complete
MKVLVMGGTRFVGKYLVSNLVSKGFDITVFTRGQNPIPKGVSHVKGDRKSKEDLNLLSGQPFDVIVDSSGRTLLDTKSLLEVTGIPKNRLLYVSSAGVYSNSALWPIDENYKIDPSSRHKGKLETESWLKNQSIPFTSFRPTYIYGPGNYNPIEKWFFDRITSNQPIPLPGDGSFITQLGHVSDLADAMTLSLGDYSTINKIYNCSDVKGITLLGLTQIAAHVAGKNFEKVNIKFFDPSKLEAKSRKAFPLRIGHFLTDTTLIRNTLNWKPRYTLEKGLKDSFDNDYSKQTFANTDFSLDQTLTYF